MKECFSCRQVKDYTDYYKQSSSQDGYQRYCKKCANKMSYRSETNNKDKYYNIRKKAKNKFAEEVRAYKAMHGCSHCGESHPAVLELHHTDPSVKDMHPSAAGGRKLFYEEAAKCIVLCANCHRKEHYKHIRV